MWIRFHGRELIVTAMVDRQPVEVARHQRSTPGNPSIDDARHPQGSHGERMPRPTRPAEVEFPAIGPGTALWLQEAGESGVRHARSKMADAVTLAKLHGSAVDRVLGTGHRTPGTTATVDRLLHHAHFVDRLAEATTGRGVAPLN